MGRPCEGGAPCHGRIGIGKGKAWPGSPRCPPGWNWRVLGMPPWRNIRALRPPSGKLAILNAEMRSAYGCTFCARVEDAACHAAPKSMGRQEALIRARRLKRCSLPISNLLNRILARSARHGKVDASYVATSLPPGTRTLRLAREAVERVARGNVQRLAGGTKKGQSRSCFP